MASKARESSIPSLKQTGGTSPSVIANKVPAKRTPTSSKTSIPTPSERRQVPNYLKPTASSRLDLTSNKTPVKKHGSASNLTSPPQRPSPANRRSSLERPPSSSQLHKILTSSGPRERTLTLKSASFSSQSSFSSRPVLEKAARTPKPGVIRPQSSTVARKIARNSPSPTSSTTLKKVDGSANRLTRVPSSSKIISEMTLNAEPQKSEDMKPDVKEVVEVVKVENDDPHHEEEILSQHLLKSDDISLEDEQDDHLLVDNDLEDQEKVLDDHLTCIIPTVEEDHHDQGEEDKLELAEEEEEGEEEEGEQEQDEEKETAKSSLVTDEHGGVEDTLNADQINLSQEEISSIEFATAEAAEDKNEEHNIEKIDDVAGETSEEETTKSSDEKPPQEVGEEEENGLNGVDSSNNEEGRDETKQMAVKTLGPSRSQRLLQRSNSKKDSPAYNDVIEETASKLLEKRKNKVRALVGAFETVISLQEPET